MGATWTYNVYWDTTQEHWSSLYWAQEKGFLQDEMLLLMFQQNRVNRNLKRSWERYNSRRKNLCNA